MEKFKSSYSKSMLLATCILVVVMLHLIYKFVFRVMTTPVNSLDFFVYGGALGLLVFTFLYAYISQIRDVCIAENEVIIRKGVGKINLPVDEIRDVRFKGSLSTDIRLLGISGLFGHIGLFWNKNSGKYIALVKDGKSTVEIRTDDKIYVISCDDYKRFMNVLDECRFK